MKKILYGMALCAGLLTTSCSSDYLNVSPSSGLDQKDALSTTDNVEKAVNGLAKMMTQQYFNRYFNGEGTIKSFYGNVMGNDYQKLYASLSAIANGTHMIDPSSIYDYYPWYYYYRIIANANSIILHVDQAKGKERDKKFLKAQALTFRAYCYSMLVQLYCNRWQDNQGESKGVVIRLDESLGDLPLSSLGKCYEQIYADLDDAIKLFNESGSWLSSSTFNYLPRIEVAYAVYARAALNREDWTTAAKYAALARKGFPLMSNAEYNAGFNTVNQEWIWSVYSSASESLYYYQYFNYEGSNSNQSWYTTRPAAISKELYDQIPATDIRRGMFLDPKNDSYDQNGKGGSELKARAHKEFGAKMSAACDIYAYMQFKQMTKVQTGVGEINLFRSAEMYLIEAEADCHIAGKEEEARRLLTALNRDSGRDPEYTCTKTGQELLDEVRLYNRIELWGEGHDWFNYKRWGLPLVRHSIAKGGSYLTAFAVTRKPSDNNNWTWIIPSIETDYNTGLDEYDE